MRIAVLNEADEVTNVILAEVSALAGLGITRYHALADDEAVEFGQVMENEGEGP